MDCAIKRRDTDALERESTLTDKRLIISENDENKKNNDQKIDFFYSVCVCVSVRFVRSDTPHRTDKLENVKEVKLVDDYYWFCGAFAFCLASSLVRVIFYIACEVTGN